MKHIKVFFLFFFSCLEILAHNTIRGKVTEETTHEPLSDVHITTDFSPLPVITDENGNFNINNVPEGKHTFTFSKIGYTSITITDSLPENETVHLKISLKESLIELSEITVVPRKDIGMMSLSAIDFNLRSHNTAQDLLRLVPGLNIAQHGGGGKAEQIFLRGFDIDHGTDIALSVDGMPVNMVSHAHGQGYADLHFVIPETIEKLNFSKGPYDARIGDLNTAGAVRFQTRNHLPENVAKLEAGRFNSYRGLVMLNLLGNENINATGKHNAYIAAEYFNSRGFFDSPINFNRYNIFGKYTSLINDNTTLSLSLSAFSSVWDQSGQIPERSVKAGVLSHFGSIDNTEGGNTSRYNVNLSLSKTLANGALYKNQLFYSRYNFNLYSNFTFFLEDSVNGDQINQFETRDILGYNTSWEKQIAIGNLETKSTIGGSFRNDIITDIGLTHTVRRRFLEDIRRGNTNQTNVSLYADESFYLSRRLTLNIGARFDHFVFRYSDKLSDTLQQPVTKNLFSPKLNIFYSLNQNAQVYFSAGRGFHSNDARVVVEDRKANTVPKAMSYDVGVNYKFLKRMYMNIALWTMDLESEFVYVGDAGIIEAGGRSRRMGIDISGRYQIFKSLYADFDFNFTKSRLLEEPEEANSIPLAPQNSGIGGITLMTKKGINFTLRYRYITDRPAIEDNSIIAEGYALLDAVAFYTINNFKFQITAENLLNSKWKEAQFATESRLKNETVPVNEIHFTPGTPFFVKASVSVSF